MRLPAFLFALHHGIGALTRTARTGLAWVLLTASLVSTLGAATPTSVAMPARIGEPPERRGTLRVAAGSAENYPYSFRNADGQVVGFTIELMDAVARVAGLKFEREFNAGAGSQTQRFLAGEYDLIQSYSLTEERRQFADFSVPFLTLQAVILVQKNGSPIKRLEDFNGRRFAIIGVGSTGEEFLRSKGIKAELVRVTSTADAMAAVETGDCAGTYLSQLTRLSLQQQGRMRNLAQLGSALSGWEIRQCVAVHKGDTGLLDRINDGLAIVHRTGEYARIYEKWFGGLGSPLLTRETVASYAAAIFALGFAIAGWAFLRQRRLRHQLAAQAERLVAQADRLMAQEALLRALYDHIPLALCVLEVEPAGNRVLTINRSAESFFATSAVEAAGRLLDELPLSAGWAEQLNALVKRASETTTMLREERLLRAMRRRVIVTLVPMIAGPAGRPRLCVLVDDITERRNLDEEIAQSRKLRAVGELVGGIAHEFNNLLTPVILQVDMIQEEWARDERLIGETRVIAESARRATELTRRLLMFGRKSESVIETMQLGAMVSSCLALLRLTVDRRIVWAQNIPADLPPLAFNPTDLNQIILNLILNARDTLLEKLSLHRENWTPTIWIEARFLPADAMGRLDDVPSRRQIRGWQRLTVRDNGMGMTPDVRERIFEPFYTTKPVDKGTGLGLATVWHLVTSLSGRIEVETVPGEGTAFHIFLPMLPAAPTPAPVPKEHVASMPVEARIFLSEDDPQVATSLINALRHEGHTLAHLTDGALAWQHLENHASDYDLLILDVNMPGLDGIELAQRVRDQGKFSGRIMIVSGHLDSDDLEQIARLRIDRVLQKPFVLKDLVGAVRESLNRTAK